MKHSSKFLEGQAKKIESIKILVFKTDPKYAEILDFSIDANFASPYLFAFFNSPPFVGKPTLDQLLWKQMNENAKAINVNTNSKGQIFLPGYGYLNTSLELTSISLALVNEEVILEHKNKNVEFTFTPLYYIENTEIEIKQYSDPLTKHWFRAYETGIPFYERQMLDIEINSVFQSHLPYLEKAIKIISQVHPSFYENEMLLANRLFVLYDEPKAWSLVHPDFHGCSFFTLTDYTKEAFFIDEVIHQCTHNYYNIIVNDSAKYFKVDATQLLGDFTSIEDHRTLMSAFHGLLTVGQRVILFPKIIESGLLDENENFELKGRFADQYKRYHTGLQHLDLDATFTQEGKELYEYFDKTTGELLQKEKSNYSKFNMDNQDGEFDLLLFKENNTIQIG